MQALATEIPGVLEIQPRVFGDARGFFVESYQRARYREHGIDVEFVQDNVSRSAVGTLRGLHLQHPHAQGKLVSVLEGRVFDVAVDVRVGSPTFGKHVARVLDAERKNQVFVPAGFAHGFCVTDGPALFCYKCTELYHPETELTLRWDDPDLAIAWPIAEPSLSEKDRNGLLLRDVDELELPRWNER
jgi:dTDP-4-dehydrorhamnose 3,5-epimerase